MVQASRPKTSGRAWLYERATSRRRAHQTIGPILRDTGTDRPRKCSVKVQSISKSVGPGRGIAPQKNNNRRLYPKHLSLHFRGDHYPVSRKYWPNCLCAPAPRRSSLVTARPARFFGLTGCTIAVLTVLTWRPKRDVCLLSHFWRTTIAKNPGVGWLTIIGHCSFTERAVDDAN